MKYSHCDATQPRVSNMRPRDQNQPAKDFNPAHWMALENVKESIHFVKYILTHFTSFSTDKDFPCHQSYDTTVMK